MGLGSLVAALPAGALVARTGERRTLFVGGLVDATAMFLAALTDSVPVLGAAVALSGATWTAFLLARQGFMIDAVPLTHRARALAALGGANRVGVLVGPLIGALMIHVAGLRATFLLAAALSVAAGLLALLMPDLGSDRRHEELEAGHPSVWAVLVRHRHVLLTLGIAVVVIGASRSMRNGLLPLWADHVGISASTTSLIFAVAAAVDICFFYPGGWLMDTRGRTVVAVPVVLSVALGCLLLPLTHSVLGLTAVVALIAVGNGLGAGIVMTLGADASPMTGRAQFLGAWRLCGDIGNAGGPLLVSLFAGFTALATASVAVGAFGLLGAAWVGVWVRRADLDRRASLARQVQEQPVSRP